MRPWWRHLLPRNTAENPTSSFSFHAHTTSISGAPRRRGGSSWRPPAAAPPRLPTGVKRVKLARISGRGEQGGATAEPRQSRTNKKEKEGRPMRSQPWQLRQLRPEGNRIGVQTSLRGGSGVRKLSARRWRQTRRGLLLPQPSLTPLRCGLRPACAGLLLRTAGTAGCEKAKSETPEG